MRNANSQTRRFHHYIAMILALCLFGATLPALASSHPPAAASHPFAQHFLALQISSSNKTRQAHIVSVAANMLKHYGQDGIAIEVVAFGPGVYMLATDSALRQKVKSLITEGVRFDACGNTLDTIERKTGKRPPLLPGVKVVPMGVVRLLTLSEQGYTIIQP